MAVMYSSPIILTRPNDQSIYQNATGFLFRPGERTFLVTNAHVLDNGYFPMKKAYPDSVFVYGNRVLEPKIISKDSDDNVDLAVIDVDGIEFDKEAPGYWGSSAAKLSTYVPHSWPLEAPKTGEATVTVGWPAKYRVHESAKVEFSAFPMLGQFVDAVTNSWFTIPFDREQWIASNFDPSNKVVSETALGGMSGSPVFALHRKSIHPLQLVGVVRTYGEGLDILYCTRADLIKPDGSIGVSLNGTAPAGLGGA